MTFLTDPLSGPSASGSQYADAGQKISPAGRRGMGPERPVARKRGRSLRPGKKEREGGGRNLRYGRRVRRSADGKDRFEIIRAAVLVGKALPVRTAVVVAMVLGMDRVAISPGPAGHHIGPAMLVVPMDIQPRHGKQVPDGQQEGRQRKETVVFVLLRIHFCKFSIKKLYL